MIINGTRITSLVEKIYLGIYMIQQLTRTQLNQILQTENIEPLSLDDLTRLVLSEPGISDFAPDGICQIDPRNGDRIIYNSARARRPHDNRPVGTADDTPTKPCVICQGKTTGVIDVADLSEGFTFINKNLFPVLYPSGSFSSPPVDNPGPNGMPAAGFHFLQWTSSLHSKDWHNMPQADRIIVLQRLAALEQKLLTGQPGGYASIFKNYGRLVGGSLAHGHQQIGFSNIMPRRIRDNWRFEQECGKPFSAYLLQENPPALTIKDYGLAALLTPYFMRRPFDMLLLLKDTRNRYLYQLTPAEITAVADGWHDAIKVMLWIMPQLGRQTAYNVVMHSGPGAGLYFEFLPYTQEMGGFEHLGLFLCQGSPFDVADRVRSYLV